MKIKHDQPINQSRLTWPRVVALGVLIGAPLGTGAYAYLTEQGNQANAAQHRNVTVTTPSVTTTETHDVSGAAINQRPLSPPESTPAPSSAENPTTSPQSSDSQPTATQTTPSPVSSDQTATPVPLPIRKKPTPAPAPPTTQTTINFGSDTNGN